MPEDIVKKIAVTFGTGLPLGTHAKFKHNGEIWIAYPVKKNTHIVTVIDRMIGIFSTIQRDMINWLNTMPEDADRTIMILESVARAKKLQQELIEEKIEGQTE